MSVTLHQWVGPPIRAEDKIGYFFSSFGYFFCSLLLFFHLPRFFSSKLEVNIPLENSQVCVLVDDLQPVLGENGCAYKFLLYIRHWCLSLIYIGMYFVFVFFFLSPEWDNIEKYKEKSKDVHLWDRIGFLSENKNCSSNY